MRASTGEPGRDWQLTRGPFLFAGIPPMLTGHVALQSLSAEKVKVREIESGPGGLGPVRLAAQLRPGERARLPAQITVDPATPPGTYETTLRCGDQLEPPSCACTAAKPDTSSRRGCNTPARPAPR